jgi:hypothetical protein
VPVVALPMAIGTRLSMGASRPRRALKKQINTLARMARKTMAAIE